MSVSKYKPNLKVRTLDEMFKKISESSENYPEQLAHTSENSPALSLSETDSGPVESESSQTETTKSDLSLPFQPLILNRILNLHTLTLPN